MPITDNIIFRLKAQSGQAAPINEVGALETMAGAGTLSLVTAGDHYAWRLSGGGVSAAVPNENVAQGTDGGGVTIAMRMRIPTFNGTAFDSLVGFSTDATPANGIHVGQAGTGTTIRGRYKSDLSAAIGTIGTTEFTIVIRAAMLAAAAADKVDVWIGTTGRSGTSPNFTSAVANATTSALDTIAWLTAGSGVIEVSNMVVFGTERTDTECANLADDIVTQLYGSGSATATMAWTEAADTVAISVSIAGAVTATAAWTEGADTVAISATASGAAGIITTPVLKNNAGTILANETGVVVNVYDSSTGALVVRKTGQTSSAGGIVTVTDALIIPATVYAYEVVLTSLGRRLPTATAA